MQNRLHLFIAIIGAGVLSAAAHAQDSSASPAAQAPLEYTVPALYLAARSGNLDKVRSLIADGTDVNVRNYTGRTALMSAVYFQNKAIVRELLGEGADVNAQDAAGRTAVMMAVAAGNIEIIGLLAASGADVNMADNQGNTALTLAEKSTLSKARKKELARILESAVE